MTMHRRAFLATAAAAPLIAAAPSASAMARDLTWIDATETAALIRKRKISAGEAVGAAIERARALNPQLNFLVTPDFERAMTRAAAPNGTPGPFAGAPILIKDLDDFEGLPTRLGSRVTEHAPVPTRSDGRTAAIVGAGFNPIGKSATPEFGFLPTTEPLAFGPTHNPWDLSRSAGGSSGGAAAAVAAGVLPLSHATDGGGSIRIPSACCGLFGLKPSRGRVMGDPSGASDLSVSLCVSRTVRDSAAFLASVERTGDGAVLPPVGLVSRPSTRKLRIAFLTVDPLGHAAQPEVADAVVQTALLLEHLGHDAEPLEAWPMDSARFTNDFLNIWAEGGREAAMLAEGRGGPGAAEKMLEPFTVALASRRAGLSDQAFSESVGRLTAAARSYLAAFRRYDVILTPVLDSPAVPLGWVAPDVEAEVLIERLTKYVGYTPLNNVAGNPAMSVPAGWSSEGLPIGVQLAADAGQERLLFELAYQLEEARPWTGKTPPVHA
jgi:amidase